MKLTLNKDTIRRLGIEQLRRVAGGTGGTYVQEVYMASIPTHTLQVNVATSVCPGGFATADCAPADTANCPPHRVHVATSSLDGYACYESVEFCATNHDCIATLPTYWDSGCGLLVTIDGSNCKEATCFGC